MSTQASINGDRRQHKCSSVKMCGLTRGWMKDITEFGSDEELNLQTFSLICFITFKNVDKVNW